jgi:F0F1-type ATP synthase delta subunit
VSVDPALIAGIQVRLGDRLLDNSIRNQLGRVRSRVSQELVEHLSLEERDAG